MVEQRILVVDDQTHIVRILKRALTQVGYIVDTASDGVEALEILGVSNYFAVITDYHMPNMDGMELCENFRKQDPNGETLLILATSIANQSLDLWAKNLANTLYLEKPVSLKRLVDLLAEYTEGKQQGNEQQRAV